MDHERRVACAATTLALLAWAATFADHPGTLLIVTADHGRTCQIVPIPTDADHPAGLVSVLITADKAPMAVAYGSNVTRRLREHTGTHVRIPALGPQAANLVGVTEQTDLVRLLDRALSGPPPRATSSRP